MIRVRPDGTGLEVVSTGERNPLSVALTATDEIFTYGNDDDSKKWPNSLTHHIVGGHYGYPYEFLNAPARALPIIDGQIGGAGAQGLCYNEDGLPQRFRGNLFFCDWGLGAVIRYEVARSGGTFEVKSQEYIVRKGDHRATSGPSRSPSGDEGRCLYLVDWAYNGFLVDGPKTGRLFRLTYTGPEKRRAVTAAGGRPLAAARSSGAFSPPRGPARPGRERDRNPKIRSLSKLERSGQIIGRIHALWALDAIGSDLSRRAIRRAMADPDAEVRHTGRPLGRDTPRSRGAAHSRSTRRRPSPARPPRGRHRVRAARPIQPRDPPSGPHSATGTPSSTGRSAGRCGT